MSDPISDLKHELLAAAVRQQSHAATGREWTRAHSRRRWVIVAVAGLVLVGGLLATPALGIGDRLLSLIQGKRSAQPGDVQAPAWSRDGRTIVFVSWRDGNGEVYAMDADGSGPRNLTQHPAKDFRPAWSPNGRRIAFVSRRDGNAEVYVMNADGSGKRNLTRDRASDDDYPTWSRDGRKLAFLRVRRCAVRIPAVCHERRRQRAAQADAPPPGDVSAGLVTGRADDLLRALPRQHRRERIADAPVHNVDPRLVARRAADRLHAPQGRRGLGGASPADIYVMNADGSGTRRLTHNAGYNAEPAWSPDGRKIAFQITRDGNREIYVMNADGSNQRNLTRNPAKDVRPSWSPDGRRIAFVSDRDGRLEAHVMNADGSGQRSLTLHKR